MINDRERDRELQREYNELLRRSMLTPAERAKEAKRFR
jgi:hypothetical protein